MTAPTSPRPTIALAAGGLLGVVLAGAGTLWLRAAADHLPERIAVHWGPDGQPDRYTDLTGAVTTSALLTALTPLLLVAVAVLVDRSARSVLGGAAAGTAVFVGAVSFGSVLAQQDTSAPVALPGAVLALGAVAALAVGIGMLPLVWVAVTVSPWLWLVAGLVGGLMVALTSARVVVDRDGVRVSTLGLS
ncbi:MAG: DUF1648 domain-containing protein [Terracoccus sp.]